MQMLRLWGGGRHREVRHAGGEVAINIAASPFNLAVGSDVITRLMHLSGRHCRVMFCLTGFESFEVRGKVADLKL